MNATVQPPPLASTAIARNSLVIIAVVVTGAALHWMSDIITPLLLAMFLAVMVDGLGRVIRRHAPFVPGRLAVTVAIVFSALLFACSAIIVADRAPSFLDALSRDEPRLIALITQITQSLGSRAPVNASQILTSLDPTAYLGTLAQALQNIATSAFLVLVYLGFLIASRHAFERKVIKLFKGREARQDALNLFLRIRDGMERYLWIQTVLGIVIAAASWLVMVLVGLENPFFWAFLVFIVNYIPIVGAVAAIALPALFALLQFGGWGHAVVLLVALWLITFVVGNILLPRMQGASLNMDPLIVLLSLAFWGAIWGLTGMFLSTPLTVLAMVILAQFPGSRWIAIILSADGDPQGLGGGARAAADQTEVAPTPAN